MKKSATVFLLILIASFVYADDDPRILESPIVTGFESFQIPENSPENSFNSELDIIGDTIHIGYTYYDWQQNGSVGRMITKGTDRWGNENYSFVWTILEDVAEDDICQVYMNTVDWSTGEPVANSWGYNITSIYRSAFPNLTHHNVQARTVPFYHGAMTPAEDICNFYSEQLIMCGCWSSLEFSFDNPIDNSCLWPKACLATDTTMHIVVSEQRDNILDPLTLIYYRIPNMPYMGGEWPVVTPLVLEENGMNITADVAVSQDGSIVVIGQTVSRYHTVPEPFPPGVNPANCDLCLYISYDGGLTFNDPLNITSFDIPDMTLLPDTIAANVDTMRAYNDLNLLIDENDVIHLAFTAQNFKYFTPSGEPEAYVMSTIYHWDSESMLFCRAADGNFFNRELGARQSIVQRPSMYKDPESGILWMVYQQYGTPGDTTDVGGNGIPNSDIYLTASCPTPAFSGKLWTNPINITQTLITGSGEPGECYSERDVSIALDNSGEYLHISYLQDKHSGSVILPDDGAEWTNNPVIYHYLNKAETVELFDSWLPNYPLKFNMESHWEDENDYIWEGIGGFYRSSLDDNTITSPSSFNLEQNYPNPFNPSTNIAFTLNNPGYLKLTVFDIMGREVASLLDCYMSSGRHEVTFNAQDFASGLYFVRLQQSNLNQTIKMLLVK